MAHPPVEKSNPSSANFFMREPMLPVSACDEQDEQGNIIIAPLRTKQRIVSEAIFDCTGAFNTGNSPCTCC